MPDGFSERDLAKPPGKRELARIDKEWRALAIWHKTTDLKAVRDHIPGVQNLRQAQILVNRAVQRWMEDSVIFADQEYVRNAMIGREVVTKLRDAIDSGDLRLTGDLVRMLDRQSKLLGLDKQKAEEQKMPTIIVQTGIPEMPVRPALPDPNVIDGEVVE